jgi:hypothetical protein
MELKPHYFAFDILESNIEHLYHSLYRSSSSIYRLVQNEIQFKGIYNPKTDSIINSENKKEFESFQEILRNLNNFIYFNSLLLGSYSIFEVVFKEICKFVEEYSTPQKEFNQPNRAILKSCRKYLTDSTFVNFSGKEIDAKYINLLKIGDVRNLFAHENGNIMQDKTRNLEEQQNYNLVKSIKELTILQNGQIYINNEDFIENFIQESESFINIIIKQLKEK